MRFLYDKYLSRYELNVVRPKFGRAEAEHANTNKARAGARRPAAPAHT